MAKNKHHKRPDYDTFFPVSYRHSDPRLFITYCKRGIVEIVNTKIMMILAWCVAGIILASPEIIPETTQIIILAISGVICVMLLHYTISIQQSIRRTLQ